MEIQTYDEILNDVCDNFDNLIAPKVITRSNTNILYLIFKAYAKGLEVISNLVVTLSRKFDPSRCSDEDLESVAKLVGTEKLQGSATGLQFTVKNNSDVPVPFKSGTYRWERDADSIFEYYNPVEINVGPQQSIIGIAMSTERKAIPVTAQSNLSVKLDGESVDSAFTFACNDNAGLLGTRPETNLDFRQRIVKGESTASLVSKMEQEIKQLPYIFDCRVRFNNSDSPILYGKTSIPAWNLLVVISGNATPKIAEIVTKYSIFQTPEAFGTFVEYKNEAFKDGTYKVYYKDFEKYKYNIDIYYEADPKAIADEMVQREINTALQKYKIINTYTDILQERDFSNMLSSLGLNTVRILNVDFHDANSEAPGEAQDYIKIPVTQIAQLNEVNFINVTEG